MVTSPSRPEFLPNWDAPTWLKGIIISIIGILLIIIIGYIFMRFINFFTGAFNKEKNKAEEINKTIVKNEVIKETEKNEFIKCKYCNSIFYDLHTTKCTGCGANLQKLKHK